VKRFDFGGNWAEFSRRAATPARARAAQAQLGALLEGVELGGRTFLDVGFGQGFSVLAASSLGARCVACDVDARCAEALEANRALFPGAGPVSPRIGSILDEAFVEALRREAGGEGFDVVHAWGVLHHTGDMARALERSASLVRPGGHLVVAIYNRHWTSPAWLAIKATYVRSPRLVQRALVAALYPVIWLAKLAVTRRNPRAMERGMDFYFDVVDWVGGYPYEYARIAEVESACGRLGLALVRAIPARVPTGCNEMVFRKA
jgi:2-polyprenyl-6-hydroxyphenyl methylase/3-demethylubiquinone-9 3-methyltransferase